MEKIIISSSEKTYKAIIRFKKGYNIVIESYSDYYLAWVIIDRIVIDTKENAIEIAKEKVSFYEKREENSMYGGISIHL